MQKYKDGKLKIYVLLLSILLPILLISVAVAFWVIPKTIAAEVTMEVYQESDGKVFGKETSLDIFNDQKFDGEKLVAPCSTGSYTFAVHNSSASDLLPYSLKLTAENPDNIPLIFSVQKNGEYIWGGESKEEMELLTEISLPKNELIGDGVDLYTLHWSWRTESDEKDTALGYLANEREVPYTLMITAIGTIDETTIDPPRDNEGDNKGGNTGGNNGGISDTIDKIGNGAGEIIADGKGVVSNIISGLEETGIVKTGDIGNVLLWIIMIAAACVLLILLLFKRRRRKEDEEES